MPNITHASIMIYIDFQAFLDVTTNHKKMFYALSTVANLFSLNIWLYLSYYIAWFVNC